MVECLLFKQINNPPQKKWMASIGKDVEKMDPYIPQGGM